jgi:hypothetical protein
MWIVRLALRQPYTCVAATVLTVLLRPAVARAEAPKLTVVHQPMICTGLAARQPFEAWFYFDKSSDPIVPGYAVPAGATFRFTFSDDFTPRAGHLPEAVPLHGWPQGAISAKFTIQTNDNDPRTVVLHLDQPVVPQPPERPGLKAIHLRATVNNPSEPGDYPITIQFANAGALSGAAVAIAHITSRPEPNVAAYNQLHDGRNEDWQRVKVGSEASLPLDFLVTLPDEARANITVSPTPKAGLRILCDGKPIGSITTEGVPMTLMPHAFGPGFSRLGIIELRARAGATPGIAQVIASLAAGTRLVIHLVVEQP